jgi:hypothetical protein
VHWFRLWRDSRIEMSSPLPVQDAELRLAKGLTRWRGLFGMGSWPEGSGSRVVVGSVSHGRVRLTAMRPGVRNSWRPVLRGELTAAPDGCRLVARLGWHPAVRVFGIVWLGFVAFLLVIGAGNAVTAGASGHGTQAARDLTFVAIAVGFVAFDVGLSTIASRWARKDGEFLLSWLNQTLQSRT